MLVADSFNSCNLKCSVEQPYRNLQSFVFCKLRGVNAQSGPVFMTHTKKICAIWPLVTVVQQNEYVRILF